MRQGAGGYGDFMTIRKTWLIVAMIGLSTQPAMAEGINLQNLLGVVVQGAKNLHEQQQRQKQNQPVAAPSAPAPSSSATPTIVAPVRNSGSTIASVNDCNTINNWVASSFNATRTQQVFGKGFREWSDADFAQTNGTISACSGHMDRYMVGRASNAIKFVNEAKRSFDRYRAEMANVASQKNQVETGKVPDDAEKFFSFMVGLNKADSHKGMTLSSYKVTPPLPANRDLQWKIDTSNYDKAVADFRKRLTAELGRHMPTVMANLKTAVMMKAPKENAKMKGRNGQDLSWSAPKGLLLGEIMRNVCKAPPAEWSLRQDQRAVFAQGCNDFIAKPQPDMITALKRDLAGVPATVEDLLALEAMCGRSSGSKPVQGVCMGRAAELRGELSGADVQMLNALLGKPLLCDAAVANSGMDAEDLKSHYIADSKNLTFIPLSFFDVVCQAAKFGRQVVFEGQGMFSGPDELVIRTNERVRSNRSEVRVALGTVESNAGADLYFGTTVEADVWNPVAGQLRMEKRPLKMMQGYPLEWRSLQSCLRTKAKSCKKQTRLLLYPVARR